MDEVTSRRDGGWAAKAAKARLTLAAAATMTTTRCGSGPSTYPVDPGQVGRALGVEHGAERALVHRVDRDHDRLVELRRNLWCRVEWRSQVAWRRCGGDGERWGEGRVRTE